ncbi:MAG TPA: L-lactate permease, partial [Pseudonocardia sp.]|uniref:L-lactate permease n=1 Tax=Pseudonocardia sp. TaxID=60912 RepID=UPI002ED85657
VALVVAVLVAVLPGSAGFHMPLGLALDSGLFGAARGVLIVLWITFNAIWIYNLTVKSGHFAVLRRSFAAISDDRRIQAIVIAFSFGALLEALAGGGSPIAIASVMLIAIGFSPLKAVAISLVANTAPVAFGGLGNPITIMGQVTELPAEQFGAMAGRQVAILAVFVPFVLVGVVDGWKGVREVWPAALTCGLSFGIAQFAFSNFVNYKLCDIFAALVSAVAVILLNKVWQPRQDRVSAPPVIAGGSIEDPAFTRRVGPPEGDSRRDVLLAFAPYAVVVVLFSLAQLPAISAVLNAPTITFNWPGLHILSQAGTTVSVAYKLNWLAATGTLLFVSGVITALVLGIKPLLAIKTYGETLRQFGWAILTILLVFAVSYVMNLSGQVSTLGLWLAQTGAFFAFLSPVVGWFGVAVTGTDAGSNALFAKLQMTAADQLHASPILFGAANTSGGVLAKMISPQNLAIGTAAVGVVGAEGILFRRVFGWSVLFLLAMCVLVFLQSTSVLGWMVVGG